MMATAQKSTKPIVLLGAPVLALDLSGSTGWCGGLAKPSWGIWKLPDMTAQPGATFGRLRNAISDTAELLRRAAPADQRITLVVERELPVTRQHHHGGAMQISLAAIARLVAHDEGMIWVDESPGRMRSAVMGPGAGKITGAEKKKGVIVRWLVREGFAVTDHNAADALICWLWKQGYQRHAR